MSYFNEVTIGKGIDNPITRLDETTTADVIYVGVATSGSATSSAVWQIKKIDMSGDLIITLADGNEEFDNVWDNRATTVVYS